MNLWLAFSAALLTGHAFAAPAPTSPVAPNAYLSALTGQLEKGSSSDWTKPLESDLCGFQAIACGQSIYGSLDVLDCTPTGFLSSVDLFQFSCSACERVSATLTAFDFSPYLSLLSPTPTLVEHDIEAGGDAHVAHTLDSSGSWTLGVTNSTSDYVHGIYRLSLACDQTGTGCLPDATTMCLNNSRFKVTATFLTGDGHSGTAQVVKLTEDTGYLWFFAGTNVELVVKVLNACSFNQHYWVFAGGLTNVNVVLTITDTKTGSIQKVYTNPQGKAFAPIQDTLAFATCP